MLPTKVAFLGPRGTYTHQVSLSTMPTSQIPLTFQAVTQQFGDDPLRTTIFPQPSIAACFDSLHLKEVDFAVVPFENSTNGQVVFTYDLLRDWFLSAQEENKPTFHIVAEQFVSIHHYLYSNAASLKDVSRLYSHPQVWGQVGNFLARENFNGKVTRVDTSSTAVAAEMVFKDATNTSACISSRMSGSLYNLQIKQENVEDLSGNTTRFLVLGHGPSLAPEIVNEKNTSMTMLLFKLNGDDPGALCSALSSFKEHGINLQSIASRPSKQTPWEYVFFVEAQEDSSSEHFRKSLRLLHESCETVVVLGLFVRAWRTWAASV